MGKIFLKIRILQLIEIFCEGWWPKNWRFFKIWIFLQGSPYVLRKENTDFFAYFNIFCRTFLMFLKRDTFWGKSDFCRDLLFPLFPKKWKEEVWFFHFLENYDENFRKSGKRFWKKRVLKKKKNIVPV